MGWITSKMLKSVDKSIRSISKYKIEIKSTLRLFASTIFKAQG